MLSSSAAPRRCRIVRALVSMQLFGFLAFLIAWLWPHTFDESRPIAIAWVWGISIARTFCLELALVSLLLPIIAIVLRRRLLAATGLMLAALWASPGIELLGSRQPPPIGGESLTVMTFNVLGRNRNHAGILDEIRQADPDVFTIQEYNLALHEAIGPHLASAFPHHKIAWWNGHFGMAFYSRLPLTQLESLPSGDSDRTMFRAALDHPSGPIIFYGVHPAHPAGVRLVADGRKAFRQVLDAAQAESSPVVIMGDLNASLWSPQDQALRRLGYRSALSLTSPGYLATWPASGPLNWFPSVRIDHIYLSPSLSAESAHVGSARGSDHRPVVATIGRRSSD